MSKYKKVIKGDIAFNSMRMWQGASGLSPYNGILSPAYTVIYPNQNIYSLFFAYLFKKQSVIHQFLINSQGLTADTLTLKFERFSKILCFYPKNIKEQKNIGNLFFLIDQLINIYQNKYQKLNNIKNSLLEKLFPKDSNKFPQIRFKGFIEDWKIYKLGELGFFQSNGVDKKININDKFINLLNYMDVYNRINLNKHNCFDLMQVTAKKMKL